MWCLLLKDLNVAQITFRPSFFTMWNNDKELFTIVGNERFIALAGDVFDKLAYFHQYLSSNMKPLCHWTHLEL